MRVAIIDEELPYPLTSGKRIRTFNLVTRLARRHQITYLCHRNVHHGEAETAASVMRNCGIQTMVVNHAVPPKTGARFYARLAANILSPLPYSVTSHLSQALRQTVREYAARNEVDVWQCEWTPYARTLRGLNDIRCVVMAHNIESLIWKRYCETEKSFLKRWYIKGQWRKFERFEKLTFAEARQVIAVSAEDAELARERFGASRVGVVDNGVDTSYFQPSLVPRIAEQILFLGSLDWRPNLDAVEQLIDQVFSAVRAEHPSARLCIVGRNPPAALVRRLSRIPQVEVWANVPDVRPYLLSSGVLAVPLRIGGGSRLKILEALACGLPVVSTKIGAEGLTLQPGRDLLVVDRVDEMAGALLQCIRAPERALAMAAQGRRVVLERYDWDTLADKLEQLWAECLLDSNSCAA